MAGRLQNKNCPAAPGIFCKSGMFLALPQGGDLVSGGVVSGGVVSGGELRFHHSGEAAPKVIF
jgi:hypothetical protein